jgi:hypothetical protein
MPSAASVAAPQGERAVSAPQCPLGQILTASRDRRRARRRSYRRFPFPTARASRAAEDCLAPRGTSHAACPEPIACCIRQIQPRARFRSLTSLPPCAGSALLGAGSVPQRSAPASRRPSEPRAPRSPRVGGAPALTVRCTPRNGSRGEPPSLPSSCWTCSEAAAAPRLVDLEPSSRDQHAWAEQGGPQGCVSSYAKR